MKWRINLDPKVIERFRDVVNERPWLFYNNNADSRKWNLLCACIDRIEDIVLYLNRKELNDKKNSRCAFDFMEFISQADVMTDCVSEIWKLVNGSNIDEKQHREIFKHKRYSKKYIVGSKTIEEVDGKYFKYIRALSSIHPSGTDRYKKLFQQYPEVSPFIVWKNVLPISGGDLTLKIYRNGGATLAGDCGLYVHEFFNYVRWVYYQLNDVIMVWKEKMDRRLSWHKSRRLKARGDFSSYNDYLDYLIHRSRKCFIGVDDMLESVGYCSRLDMNNYKNRNECERFRAQLVKTVEDLRKKMQDMNIPAISDENLPIAKLLYKAVDEEDSGPNGSYYFEKVSELIAVEDATYARSCIVNLLPFLNKYISLTKKDCFVMSREELYVTIMSAKYLYFLERGWYRER